MPSPGFTTLMKGSQYSMIKLKRAEYLADRDRRVGFGFLSSSLPEENKENKKTDPEKEDMWAIEESVKVFKKFREDGHIKEVSMLASQMSKVVT